eukprot:TRINITY_DN6943_c0_g1_i3.p1 TRINITY_DN6943_c0_g1~~TRINITY_DN6943_c0_g1_i3.p1  ORF type:complete len:150 (+),score=12.67 TRINITY_DN6943_c0_g1_i3:242-691(+)
MDTLKDLKDLILSHDFCSKYDIKDAYPHLNFKKAHRKFVCAWWRGKLFQFRSMIFGINEAARWLTKALRPVAAFFRKKGLQCIFYLDNLIFLHGPDTGIAKEQASFVKQTLLELGFLFNWEKCIFTLTKRFEALDYIIDTSTITVNNRA